MAEYTARQSAFPDEIGNTLGAFLGGLQKAHHNNIITEVEFIKTVSALDNIETKLEVGVIDSEQALTIMQSLPAIEYCDDEGFGLDTGEIEMNMRVSAHTEDKSTDSEEVESKTDVSASAGFGIFGHAKVHQSITGHFSHGGEHANESDYSAYTQLKVTMKRTKPSPARRLTSELMQEAIKDTHQVMKSILKHQKAELDAEVAGKDVPKSIPKQKDGKKGENSESSDGGDDRGSEENSE